MINLINKVLKVFGYQVVRIEEEKAIVEAKEKRAMHAAEVKASRARQAVEEAIEEIKAEGGQRITIAEVARRAGVARNTARKYIV